MPQGKDSGATGADDTRIDALPPPPRVRDEPQFQVGDVLAGRYRLVEKLGAGAMGEVFVGENELGRRVAIKLLKANLVSDDEFRRRFRQEAAAVAAIDHRNVARFLEVVEGDPTFLVMEFVSGPTLAQVLRTETRLAIGRAVNVAVRLAWALEAAHAAGVIHRDIKPSNVVLAPDPELGDEPKLIDFGLAKLPQVVGAEMLTRSGQIVGTPAYMSPEQIANKDVDARSEVYALGCLLYHMLVGKPPFAGGDDVQTLYQQIEAPPPKLREVMPEAPPPLEAIVARALAKSPDARFQSMRDFARALAGVDRRRPVPPAEAPQQQPWRVAVVACAAGALVSLVAVRAGMSGARGGLLVVSSRPTGAKVDVDGRPQAETTPTALRGLSAGKHRVQVKLPNHDPVEQVVLLGQDERVAVDIVLPPATHAIEVQTVPSSANVWLDGEQAAGETPLTVHIADDDFHQLRLERLGYEPEIVRIQPADTRTQIVETLRPETQPRGLVTVDSSGASEIWIDGRDTGFVTPSLGIRVSAGAHEISLHDGNGKQLRNARVNVRQGENVHLMLDGSGGCEP